MIRLFRRDVPRVAEISHLDIAHDGAVVRVALKRVPTARRYTLRVRAATRDVVLTMPKRGTLAAARDFAQRHAAWIGARLRRLPQPVPFAPGQLIPLRGVDHRIVHRPAARGTTWTESEADGAALLCVAGGAGHVARRVADFMKREARRDLETAVARHVAAIGARARKITLRDTTSRWGSCTADGSLSFSWRLIMAPPHVLDYLAAHEAAHLIHLDHSPRFWALTRRLAPDTDRAEAWLKAHGASLHRYGPDAHPDVAAEGGIDIDRAVA